MGKKEDKIVKEMKKERAIERSNKLKNVETKYNCPVCHCNEILGMDFYKRPNEIEEYYGELACVLNGIRTVKYTHSVACSNCGIVYVPTDGMNRVKEYQLERDNLYYKEVT
jgi:transcription elongation factor Elf1